MIFYSELINSGEELCNPGHEYGGKRDYFLLHMVLNGNGSFYSDNKKWELGYGDSFLIFPNQMHLYKADKDNPWHYFWIGFKGSYHDLFYSLQIDKSNPVIHSKDIRRLYNEYNKIESTRIKQHPSLTLNNLSILNSILAQLCKDREHTELHYESSKTTVENHVKSIECYILDNFNRTIQVSDILDFIQLERSYASRIFKEEKGISIGSFLRSCRMNRAKEYLESGFSVKESAYSCGYNDYNNFLKAFKKYFGVTAGSFKN